MENDKRLKEDCKNCEVYEEGKIDNNCLHCHYYNEDSPYLNLIPKALMEKHKILLMQFHDEKGNEKVKQMVKNPFDTDDVKIYSTAGYKILSIHDHNSKLLTHYQSKEDKTDISCLKDKEGYFIVTVSKNEYGNFFWYRWILGEFLESENDIIGLKYGRECTEEESFLLNKVYPEYLANAF